MKRTYAHCPFARYADDAVVRCCSQKQAEAVMHSIALRLEACGLTMHPEKSKIVYCKDSGRTGCCPHVQFTFLGFTFRPRDARNKQDRIFTSFQPGASNEATKRMRQTVREWRLHRQSPGTLAELAQQYNPVIRGWWNYYGAFYRTVMYKLLGFIDSKLEQWARRKYKNLSRHKQGSADWLRQTKRVHPEIFFHWTVAGNRAG